MSIIWADLVWWCHCEGLCVFRSTSVLGQPCAQPRQRSPPLCSVNAHLHAVWVKKEKQEKTIKDEKTWSCLWTGEQKPVVFAHLKLIPGSRSPRDPVLRSARPLFVSRFICGHPGGFFWVFSEWSRLQTLVSFNTLVFFYSFILLWRLQCWGFIS